MADQPKTFDEALDEVLEHMRVVLKKKNKDYGPTNIIETGEQGVLIRASDKMSRLKNLYGITNGSWQKQVSNFESLEDSWLDLANYSVIAQMLLKGSWGLPHEEDIK